MINGIYILLAILGLGFLVFIHELGHYLMARRNGMRIEVFSIGFGKPIFSWMYQDVKWQVCWIFFGGYVRIAGMEKENDLEPYEIKDGFFNKSPWARIKVALFGPIVNITFALIALSILWCMGGREKNLSELTPTIGWVDNNSEIYQMGVRPGDKINSYNDYDYTSSKDHTYAAMLSGDKVVVKGFHISEEDGSETAFEYTVTPYSHPDALEKGFLTTGIMSPASYLIYNPLSLNQEPLHESGILPGDRIVWANGELIYSPYQLSKIVNDDTHTLTVQRQDNIIVLKASKKYLIKNKPFINDHNQITKDLNLLHRNDTIIAVDGQPISGSLFPYLNNKLVNIIVERNNYNNKILMGSEQSKFNYNLDYNSLNKLKNQIGTNTTTNSFNNLHLLNPIKPLPRSEFMSPENSAKINELWSQRKEAALQIKDIVKRERALEILEWQKNQVFLGINSLADLVVVYNPKPIALFGELIHEMGRTLKALLAGNLNPKWLGGPIGIMQIMHHGWSLGIKEALFWMAFISLNLGILNLLPIPALDGGHVVLSIYELVTKHRIKAKTMEMLIIPFVILLVGLFVFLSYQDILRLIQSLWH